MLLAAKKPPGSVVAEGSAFAFRKGSLVLAAQRRVEPAGDAPAEGPSEGGALAYALRRAAAASARWIVEVLKQMHPANLSLPRAW